MVDGSAATANKFRKYMLIRTQMSVVTGLLVWALAWVAGLQFATEWEIIAFVLNYIPFIGPFVATLFPTLLAMTQFATWQAVLGMFAGLNMIQFAVGSYIEPCVGGRVICFAVRGVLFRVLLDFPVGIVRGVHRCAYRHRDPDVLQLSSRQPVYNRSFRRAGASRGSWLPDQKRLTLRAVLTFARAVLRWVSHRLVFCSAM